MNFTDILTIAFQQQDLSIISTLTQIFRIPAIPDHLYVCENFRFPLHLTKLCINAMPNIDLFSLLSVSQVDHLLAIGAYSVDFDYILKLVENNFDAALEQIDILLKYCKINESISPGSKRKINQFFEKHGRKEFFDTDSIIKQERNLLLESLKAYHFGDTRPLDILRGIPGRNLGTYS